MPIGCHLCHRWFRVGRLSPSVSCFRPAVCPLPVAGRPLSRKYVSRLIRFAIGVAAGTGTPQGPVVSQPDGTTAGEENPPGTGSLSAAGRAPVLNPPVPRWFRIPLLSDGGVHQLRAGTRSVGGRRNVRLMENGWWCGHQPERATPASPSLEGNGRGLVKSGLGLCVPGFLSVRQGQLPQRLSFRRSR